MFPWLATCDPIPNFRGGNVAVFAFQLQRPMGEQKSAASLGDKKVELAHHACERTRVAVVPVGDPFRGVGAADEAKLGLGTIDGAALICDLDEKAAVGRGD